MGTHNPQSGQPETRRFLTAAEYFLRHRDFANCRKYALRAMDSDPTHPAPPLILPITSVLSAPKICSTRHDYYAIFNLPHFEPDLARIQSIFSSLASVLSPNGNPYPLSSEAFDLVSQAWSVLSDPTRKARFDDELRRHLGGCTSGSDGGTFWTMCPYCYYVYEYDRVFEECCLRCANERCRRGFHAVAVAASPPPEAVAKGYYWCAGFVPLMTGNGNGEEIGWVPFAPSGSSHKERDDHKSDCNGEGIVDSISEDDENAATVEEMGFQDHGDGRRLKIEGQASNDVENGVEFFEGDDDVLVGLNCDLDVGNGIL